MPAQSLVDSSCLLLLLPLFWHCTGLGSASALGTVAALSAVSAATVLPAMWLVGRCNRRVLFLAATTTVVATFFVEALAFSGGFTRDVRLGLAIAAFVVFLIAFQVCVRVRSPSNTQLRAMLMPCSLSV